MNYSNKNRTFSSLRLVVVSPPPTLSLSRNKVINWTSEVSDRSMWSCRLEQQTSSDLWLWEACRAHGEDLCVNIFSWLVALLGFK